MCICVLHECMYVCIHVYSCHLQRSEEGVRVPETRIRDACKLPFGCRKMNQGPLKEPQELLPTELSLQFLCRVSNNPLLFNIDYQLVST